MNGGAFARAGRRHIRDMRAGFGDFVIDSLSRRLLRRGQVVEISSKGFELLLLMVEACPNPLTRTEILQLVWPETFVSGGTIAATVAELRQILGDDSKRQRFIRTIPRFGYAFCADLRRLPEIPPRIPT